MALYEWDPVKERANVRKHGVDFETALHVFDDPAAITDQDRIEGGEYRWQTIGLVNGVRLLLVAYTVRDSRGDETIRIISARRATRREERRYEAELETGEW